MGDTLLIALKLAFGTTSLNPDENQEDQVSVFNGKVAPEFREKTIPICWSEPDSVTLYEGPETDVLKTKNLLDVEGDVVETVPLQQRDIYFGMQCADSNNLEVIGHLTKKDYQGFINKYKSAWKNMGREPTVRYMIFEAGAKKYLEIYLDELGDVFPLRKEAVTVDEKKEPEKKPAKKKDPTKEVPPKEDKRVTVAKDDDPPKTRKQEISKEDDLARKMAKGGIGVVGDGKGSEGGSTVSYVGKRRVRAWKKQTETWKNSGGGGNSQCIFDDLVDAIPENEEGAKRLIQHIREVIKQPTVGWVRMDRGFTGWKSDSDKDALIRVMASLIYSDDINKARSVFCMTGRLSDESKKEFVMKVLKNGHRIKFSEVKVRFLWLLDRCGVDCVSPIVNWLLREKNEDVMLAGVGTIVDIFRGGVGLLDALKLKRDIADVEDWLFEKSREMTRAKKPLLRGVAYMLIGLAKNLGMRDADILLKKGESDESPKVRVAVIHAKKFDGMKITDYKGILKVYLGFTQDHIRLRAQYDDQIYNNMPTGDLSIPEVISDAKRMRGQKKKYAEHLKTLVDKYDEATEDEKIEVLDLMRAIGVYPQDFASKLVKTLPDVSPVLQKDYLEFFIYNGVPFHHANLFHHNRERLIKLYDSTEHLEIKSTLGAILFDIQGDKRFMGDFIREFGSANNSREMSYFQNVILKGTHPERLKWFLGIEPPNEQYAVFHEKMDRGAVRILYAIGQRGGELKEPAEKLLGKFLEAHDRLKGDQGLEIQRYTFEENGWGHEVFRKK